MLDMSLKTIEVVSPVQHYQYINPVKASVEYSTSIRDMDGYRAAVDFFSESIKRVDRVINLMKQNKYGIFEEKA